MRDRFSLTDRTIFNENLSWSLGLSLSFPQQHFKTEH